MHHGFRIYICEFQVFFLGMGQILRPQILVYSIHHDFFGVPHVDLWQ